MDIEARRRKSLANFVRGLLAQMNLREGVGVYAKSAKVTRTGLVAAFGCCGGRDCRAKHGEGTAKVV
ncbi:hypothetical protein IHQ71_09100 [Rhizobium sp. TH2]|uniref:hypothetical protein n=1 Tax=Rhizobium sp. TH2 TaxID=2775403 RepID=UPI002158459D|nr:hypothetical protein [Rhizobium sp. TH2]UVC10716.1 hypothetical protein IHQ71_09100 [Rhizobium sp. TH2]